MAGGSSGPPTWRQHAANTRVATAAGLAVSRRAGSLKLRGEFVALLHRLRDKRRQRNLLLGRELGARAAAASSRCSAGESEARIGDGTATRCSYVKAGIRTGRVVDVISSSSIALSVRYTTRARWRFRQRSASLREWPSLCCRGGSARPPRLPAQQGASAGGSITAFLAGAPRRHRAGPGRYRPPAGETLASRRTPPTARVTPRSR